MTTWQQKVPGAGLAHRAAGGRLPSHRARANQAPQDQVRGQVRIRSSGPGIFKVMAKKTLDEERSSWRKAEDKYAEAVKPFLTDDGSEQEPDKKSAILLAQLRAKADSKMSTYFKRALRD